MTTEQFEPFLQRLHIPNLNEMQLAAITAIQENNQVQLLSSTGSGKTLAFLLPLTQLLNKSEKQVQAMIVAPSRELALQIDEVFRKMGTGCKATCCYGGHKREIEETNLIESPALIIGTPGRIGDHIRRGNFDVNHIHTIIIDEFDKALELGFQEEMEFIFQSLPAIQKTILTSATKPPSLPAFLGITQLTEINFLQTVEKPEIDELLVCQVHSPEKDKLDTLFKLICQVGNKSLLIFCNHRDSVERTSTLLQERGIFNVFYHGGMEQRDREMAMCKFKNGTSDILVTTDLASRGLDIPFIKYVIHYQLPLTEDVYQHRNGRTARMFAGGKSVMIVGPEEKLPPFVNLPVETIELMNITPGLPESPRWSTLFIDAGKKDKINKIDIVGFLSQVGGLKKEDLGVVEVKDFFAFAGIRKNKMASVLEAIKDEKIKGKKVKMAIAK